MKRRPPSDRQQGAIAVLVAVALIAMVGMLGVALDTGQLFVVKSELQNAADGCALAAAQSLGGSDGRQLQIAEAAGLAIAERHSVQFQKKPVTLSADSTVEFAANIGGPWLRESDLAAGDPAALAMRYARCTIAENGIPTWVVQVLTLLPGVDIGPSMVNASATAQLRPASTTCAIPVAICSENVDSINAKVGDWLVGPSTPDAETSYPFQWVDLIMDSKGSSSADMADMLTGNGACDLPTVGTKLKIAGARAGLSSEWNTRFGIYGQGSATPQNAQPDTSGHAYWSGSNTFNDFAKNKRTANTPYTENPDVRINAKTILGSTQLKEYGGDRRVAIVPVVNCSAAKSASTGYAVQSWACIFMPHPMGQGSGGAALSCGSGTKVCLEYLGSTSLSGSPCATSGVPGSPSSVGPRVPTLVR